ncbi:amidohydrolase family protein [Ancylobacter sp. Lp-2]|uniref:amidohydrolase family protein n=1 Tax=Ancylobacter sp. Lp-2 TaxID=2881339 RepID=UPI001E290332|nr:amidohydrolase family protein [Ancylobacter sp. Lp-2]MCB4770447.1 amidohydrolase family protein [Ancylobacter sp. Lp-2]
MSTETDWQIIDVHTHIRPKGWTPQLSASATARDREVAAVRAAKLTDVDLLVRESEEGGIDLRLLSATIEGFFGIEGPTDAGEIARVNDFLAETVAAHPNRLGALATVDAFAGESAAREAERAVRELGHVGIVIDSARDGLFINDPRVRPTLEVAAALKVPVLVHPVAAPIAEALTRAAGVPGNSFGRGLVNGTAFLSVLHAGILDDLPDLHLIFTAIGAGALVLAAAESEHYGAKARSSGKPRPNIYFDIMGQEPAVIRFLIDLAGPERVVVGSDWPIWAPVSRQGLAKALDAAGLSAEEQALIAGGNASRLLNLRPASQARAAE